MYSLYHFKASDTVSLTVLSIWDCCLWRHLTDLVSPHFASTIDTLLLPPDFLAPHPSIIFYWSLLIASKSSCLRVYHFLSPTNIHSSCYIYWFLPPTELNPPILRHLLTPWSFTHVQISFRLMGVVTTWVASDRKSHVSSGIETKWDTVPVDNISLMIISVRWSNLYPEVIGDPATSNTANTYRRMFIWHLNPNLPLSLWYLSLGRFLLVSLGIIHHWYVFMYLLSIALRYIWPTFRYSSDTVRGSTMSWPTRWL